MNYLGITNYGNGIGDKLQWAALPENYFKTTGNKMVDLDNCWIFDHNPYIVRNERPNIGVINLWSMSFPSNRSFLSPMERLNQTLGIKTFLRHPRLYLYEDIKLEPLKVAVHTTGRSFGEIDDKIIEQIKINYAGYEIYQIGGILDKKTQFNSYLGHSLWDTTKFLASCGTFIGINSGMMNLAKCFPRMRKKIIIQGQDLNKFSPCKEIDYWIDFNWEYYNNTEDDLGISYTYLKI